MGEGSCKEGVLLEIVILRGYNSRACTRFGLGGPKGYLWSWGSARPRQLAGWKNWFGLVEFQNLGRTFGYREKQGETTSKDSNKGGSTSYLQVFSKSLYGKFCLLNIKGLYVVIILATCIVNSKWF